MAVNTRALSKRASTVKRGNGARIGRIVPQRSQACLWGEQLMNILHHQGVHGQVLDRFVISIFPFLKYLRTRSKKNLTHTFIRTTWDTYYLSPPSKHQKKKYFALNRFQKILQK